MMLADADVDYSQYDAVYVFASATANIPVSPTFNAFAGGGVTLDGKEIHNGVTFGDDVRRANGYGAHVLAHETGHMLGLIDLYSLTGQDASTLERYMATILKYVGAWSLMGWTGKSGHWFAYEKLKLGYLDDNQVTCISPATGGVEEVVTPLETAGGVKAVMVQLDTSRALVVEVRSAIGSDTTLCSQGVLIYQVDAQIATGAGAVVIRPSNVGTDQAKINTCGTYWDATFDATGGAQGSFTDAASGVTMQVLAAEPGGAFRLRVKRP
jgi:M6 family metalloprotease-like protein